MKQQPKKCPFCKEYPRIVKDPLWHGSHGYHGYYEYYVQCDNEKCKIKPRTRSYDDLYDRTEKECVEKAISDWNDRDEK